MAVLRGYQWVVMSSSRDHATLNAPTSPPLPRRPADDAPPRDTNPPHPTQPLRPLSTLPHPPRPPSLLLLPLTSQSLLPPPQLLQSLLQLWTRQRLFSVSDPMKRRKWMTMKLRLARSFVPGPPCHRTRTRTPHPFHCHSPHGLPIAASDSLMTHAPRPLLHCENGSERDHLRCSLSQTQTRSTARGGVQR